MNLKKLKFITIFNRRELCITMNPEERYRICTILSRNNIKYDLKITNLINSFSRGGSRSGTFGIDLRYMYEYKIYVHKDDEEEAGYLIRK